MFSLKLFYNSILIAQAVCDYQGIFIDKGCRRPGYVHNANVFANSKVCEKVPSDEILVSYHTLFPGQSKVPNYLIGYPAYPLAIFNILQSGGNQESSLIAEFRI